MSNEVVVSEQLPAKLDDVVPSVKLADVINAVSSLKAISEEKFALDVSLKLVKLKRWVDPLFTEYDAYRTKETNRLAVPSEKDPGTFVFQGPAFDEFKLLIETYLNQSVKIPDNLKLRVEDLKSISSISPATLNNLLVVIEDVKL